MHCDADLVILDLCAEKRKQLESCYSLKQTRLYVCAFFLCHINDIVVMVFCSEWL